MILLGRLANSQIDDSTPPPLNKETMSKSNLVNLVANDFSQFVPKDLKSLAGCRCHELVPEIFEVGCHLKVFSADKLNYAL